MKTKSLVGNLVGLNGIKKSRIIYSETTGLIEGLDQNNIFASPDDSYIYNDDCLIFPGMGDIHIHAREDVSKINIYKEDFYSACCAAINGGVTHLGDMPNNPIPPIDDESYAQKVLLTQNQNLPFLMYAGIGPKTSPLSYKVPYKAFMGPSIGDLFFSTNSDLENSIKRYRDQWVSFHCEDPIILENNKSLSNHFLKRPIEAELLATDFALSLIEKYNLSGKLCHYSSGLGLANIIKKKKAGLRVLTEVTPQHLFFSEELIKKNRLSEEVFFQMNPPIRSEFDRELMLDALQKGDLDFLATDHAPHSFEEKSRGMSGMPGLDTYGLFVTWLLNEMKIDPIIVLKMTAINPGLFFNEFLPSLQKIFPHYRKYGSGLGIIQKNYSASFTVLNLNKSLILEKSHLNSKAKWSPFLGHKFSGSVEATFVAGSLLR